MKNKSETIYAKADRFAELTKKLIIEGKIVRARKCFDVAAKLFETGNYETKNAISNVFLFSISDFIEWHRCSIQNMFPKSLREEYLKQANACGS